VKPERVGENIKLVKKVFEELHTLNIAGVKYSVYQMGENVFVYFTCFENEEADLRFRSMKSFKAFQKDHIARQMEKPIITDIEEIESF
jgi:hypothetical protein